MKIYNTDTEEEIEIVYAPTGCDCMCDISSDDPTIVYNQEEDRLEANSESIRWWEVYVHHEEQADAYIKAVRTEYLSDQIDDVINDASACDLEDQPKAIMAALTEDAAHYGMRFKTYGDGSLGLVSM